MKWEFNSFRKWFGMIHGSPTWNFREDLTDSPSEYNHFDIAAEFKSTGIRLFNFDGSEEKTNESTNMTICSLLGKLGEGFGYIQCHNLPPVMTTRGWDNIVIYPLLKHAILGACKIDFEVIPKKAETCQTRMARLLDGLEMLDDYHQNLEGYRAEISIHHQNPFTESYFHHQLDNGFCFEPQKISEYLGRRSISTKLMKVIIYIPPLTK